MSQAISSKPGPKRNRDSPVSPAKSAFDRTAIVTILCLAFLTLVAFWPAFGCGFIVLDDEGYVTKNSDVQAGLTPGTAVAAFQSLKVGNWHPLTWLSLQTDVTLFGTGPAGFHGTNVALHVCNAVFLYLALLRFTGRQWPSAIVAALFAVHPLRVESVVWVSERKDVLSSFFGFLALLAYSYYVKRPSLSRYFTVLLLFVFSLLAKPMWVTFPFLLLLLDWWPSGRLLTAYAGAGRSWRGIPLRPLLEKIPFFILTIDSSVITWIAQRESAAASLELVPLELRVANALVSYVFYLLDTIWPVSLAPFYPLATEQTPLTAAVICGMVLVAITVIVWLQRSARPYLPVGWFWYLGTLVPVIGLVQVGSQARADRYTYLPLIGIFIAVVWTADDLAGRLRQRTSAIVAAGVVVVTLTALCHSQAAEWRDDVTLWTHTLHVTSNNWMALYCRGLAEEREGRVDAAIDDFAAAMRIAPAHADIRAKLALLLMARKRDNEALACLSTGLRFTPNSGSLHYAMGVYYHGLKQLGPAREHYETALRLDPNIGEAHSNLGALFRTLGDYRSALEHLSEAVRIDPRNDVAFFNLGKVLESQEQLDGAIDAYQRAVRIAPTSPRNRDALNAAMQKQASGQRHPR